MWKLATLGAILAAGLHAQIFEVASVKIERIGPQTPMPRRAINTTPGTLSMRFVSLATCIAWAYHMQDYQISVPGSMDEDRFAIAAKAGDPVSSEGVRKMLQALLVERFKIAFHHESKMMSVYALTIGKNGHKLQPSDGDDGSIRPQQTSIVARTTPLEELAALLTASFRTPVVDMTGLEGRFDFKFDLAKYASVEPIDGMSREGSMTFEAVQQELGLKIERRKAVVDVLVIDHWEKPTDN